MTSRFRVAPTLGRELEELGVSTADVSRRADLPAGTFHRDRTAGKEEP